MSGRQQQYGKRSPGSSDHRSVHGLLLLDNANFEQFSEICAELGRYEFMLVISPLVIEGGTGAPANPLTLF